MNPYQILRLISLVTVFLLSSCSLIPLALNNTLNRLVSKDSPANTSPEEDSTNDVYFLNLQGEVAGGNVNLSWTDYVIKVTKEADDTYSYKTPANYTVYSSTLSPWEGFTEVATVSDSPSDTVQERIFYADPVGPKSGKVFYRIQFGYEEKDTHGKIFRYSVLSEAWEGNL